MVCNTGAGLSGLGRSRYGIAASLAPGTVPVLYFSAPALYGYRPARATRLGAAGRPPVVVGADRRAGRPGVWRCRLPDLDAGLSASGTGVQPDRPERHRAPGGLAGHAAAVAVPGNWLLHQSGVGVPEYVDGQLVGAVFCRYRRLRHFAVPQQLAGLKKQNPPKGGFVECWRKPNYFSFTSL